MRHESIHVERARPDQAEALTTMVRTSAAYHGPYHAMVANQRLDTVYLDTNLVRVAHGPGGQIWGFYSLLVPGRGGDGEGELDFMFVANHLQGRGIGRTLFEDMRVMAGRLGLSRMHIVSHPPAEPFYLACGARRIGQIPPAGRVTWTRPYLALDLRAPTARLAAESNRPRRYASATATATAAARPTSPTETCPVAPERRVSTN